MPFGVGGGFSFSVQRLEEEEERKRRAELAQAAAAEAAKVYSKQAETRRSLWNAPNKAFQDRAQEVTKITSAKPKDGLEEFWHASRKMGGQKNVGYRMASIKTLWDTYMKPVSGAGAIWQLTMSPYEMDEIEEMLRAGRAGLNFPPAGFLPKFNIGAASSLGRRDGPWYEDFWNFVSEGTKGIPGEVKGRAAKVKWTFLGGEAPEEHQPAIDAADAWDLEHKGRSPYNANEALMWQAMEGRPNDPRVGAAVVSSLAVGGVGREARAVAGLAEKAGTFLSKGLDVPGRAVTATKAGKVSQALGRARTALGGAPDPYQGWKLGTQIPLAERIGLAAGKATILTIPMLGMQEPLASLEYESSPLRKVEPEAKRFLANPYVESSVVKDFDDMITVLDQGTPEDERGWQESIQKDITDDDGKVIISGRGKHLTANGLRTDEWEAQYREWYGDYRRFGVDVQLQLIEAGIADSDLPIDGLIQGPKADPRWLEVMERAQRDFQDQQNFSQDHPILGAALEMMGIPITKDWAAAKFRKIFSHGILTGALSTLFIEPIKFAGGAYNAALSTLTYKSVEMNDPEYQQLKKQWQGEVDAGNPNATATLDRLQQRQAQLITEGFNPDPILWARATFGGDVNEAIAWSKDHPGSVLAASLIRDIALIPVGPRLKKAFKPPVPRTFAAFAESSRAARRVSEITKRISASEKTGLALAEDLIRGTDAGKVAKELDAIYYGRLSATKSFYKDMAQRVREGIDAGDAQIIEKTTTYTGLPAEALLKKLRAVKAKAGLEGEAAIISRDEKIAKILAKEQRTGKQLVDFKEVATQHLADAWGNRKLAIFPHLDNPELGRTGRGNIVHRALLNSIAKVESPQLRKFLSLGIRKLELKPMREVEFNSVYGGSRVFANALAASGDVGWALEMRSRWIRNPSPAARQALAGMVKERLALTHKISLTGEGPPEIAVGGVQPRTGEVIAKERVALPNQLRYAADFGPIEAESNAALRILKKETRQGKHVIEAMPRYEQVLTKYIVNPERAFMRVNNRISSHLRRATVATGPFLFVKHAFTDTSRSALSVGPRTVLRPVSAAKRFQERIAGASAATRNDVLYRKARAIASEAHFNIGGVHGKVKWDGARIYDELGRPKKMTEGVNALRLMATDPLFRAWSEGGAEGMKKWLATNEGKAFLGRGNHFTEFKKLMEDMTELKGEELVRATIDNYVSIFEEQFFSMWNDVAPQITAGLRDMALGKGVAPTVRNIRKLVEDVNRDGVLENPYASMPDSIRQPLTHFLVGKWMTPNKLNRAGTFNKLFNDAFDDLTKNGATPDEAARIASDLAELNVSRIHFDLANMLYAEQQHRYAAWFMTKHRLYNKYIFRTMIERPSIAGAAQSLWDYLEKMNEDRKDLPEWEQHKIVIPLGWLPGAPKGSEMRADAATIFWLSEFATESAPGQIIEWFGGKTMAWLPGLGWTDNIGALGVASGRWDRTVISMAAAVPVLYLKSRGMLDEEAARDLLDGKGAYGWIPESGRRRIAKAMDISMMVAMSEGRELEPVDALVEAAWKGWVYETVQMFKVWPGRIAFGGEVKGEKLMSEMAEATPEGRLEILQNNPEARYMFGIYSTNPVEQHAVVDGWTAVAKLFQDRAEAIEAAYKSGKLLEPGYAKSIYDRFNYGLAQITDEDWRDPETGEPSPKFNKVFSGVWKGSGMHDLTTEEIMQSVVPLVDPKVWTIDSYLPTEEQRVKYETGLKQNFEEALAALGLKSDSDEPYIRWLRKDMVTDPLDKFMKYQTGDRWTTALQNRVAEDLARTSLGLNAKTQFLTQVQNLNKMTAYAKGALGTSKKGYTMKDPLFATMTTAEKAEMGWDSDGQAERMWRTYTSLLHAQKLWMQEQGIKSGSKDADRLDAALLEWGNTQAERSPSFKKEWEFAQKPLWERLDEIGVGSGGSQADRGWDEFLSTVSAYRGELASIYNKYTRSNGVGPGTKTSRDAELAYISDWLRIKRDYPDWWRDFQKTFTFSQFGIGYWKLEDGSDKELWVNEPRETVEYSEEE